MEASYRIARMGGIPSHVTQWSALTAARMG